MKSDLQDQLQITLQLLTADITHVYGPGRKRIFALGVLAAQFDLMSSDRRFTVAERALCADIFAASSQMHTASGELLDDEEVQ